MHRTLTIAAIAVVVLAGVVKMAAAPVRVATNTNTSTISTYDLDTKYSGINRLPVEEAPLP
jgi:hypothetical protein